MNKFTKLDIITCLTALAFLIGTLFWCGSTKAGEIDLWAPVEQTQPVPATTSKQEPAQPELNPKSLVDQVETVIQKGEAIEQQGRRLKRLFDK